MQDGWVSLAQVHEALQLSNLFRMEGHGEPFDQIVHRKILEVHTRPAQSQLQMENLLMNSVSDSAK